MNQTTVKSEMDDVYRLAHEEAVLVDRSALSMLKFSGETRLDLINRMSTQNVIDLKKYEGAATVLTTDIGRIIDRLILYVAKDTVYCFTGENNGEAVAQYLMRFVFFMDDFQVEDLSSQTAVYGLYGRRSAEKAQELFGPLPELPLHHWRQLELGSSTVYLHRTDPVAGDGFFISCERVDAPSLLDHLLASGLQLIGDAEHDYLRIEAALPRFGRELTADYIPLESGLWSDVSFNKGCYTGQEIIARMESRGRLAKSLVRLKLPEMVDEGAELTSQGKKAGSITSIANGPAGVLALGYVKTSMQETGNGLFTGQIPVEFVSNN